MGCICSRNISSNSNNNSEMQEGIPTGTNKRFKRNPKWKSEVPLSLWELKKKKEQFWDTAPEYEGRQEIWLALKAVCEAEDDLLAQAILDGANIILPTGYLTDGVYDELGNRYVIPLFCIQEPADLVVQNPSSSNSSNSNGNESKKKAEQEEQSLISTKNSESSLMTVVLRLSTNKDIQLNSVSATDTIHDLRERMYQADENTMAATNIRFMCMGRLLDEKKTVQEAASLSKFSNAILLQVMLTFPP